LWRPSRTQTIRHSNPASPYQDEAALRLTHRRYFEDHRQMMESMEEAAVGFE
jgi:hypothetical protein